MSVAGQSSAWRFLAAIDGAGWPAVPAADTAATLALLEQFEASQWLPPDRLAALQTRQLEQVLRHSYDTVPYYRARWGRRAPGAEHFAGLPLLTRRELQDNFETLKSTRVPAQHGPVSEVRTSGSTGMPIRTLRTPVNGLFWRAFTLRDHLWHGRDLTGKLAVIRFGARAAQSESWGVATENLIATGPAVVLGLDVDADAQLEWLQRERPDYLLAYPTLVRDLAQSALARGIQLPSLREVRTFTEQLLPDVRESCMRAWGTKVTDMYSASETGYIALQCPLHEHYHVQAESVLVEVLDDAGLACPSGTPGRVVLTTLHNFAMPLIRYEIGDFAELGEPCECGRGLPVLGRIAGRVHNMLVTAEGRRYWPYIRTRDLLESVPLRQQQYVQKAHDLIEARVVVAAPLTLDQERQLRNEILANLPPNMRLAIVYCDRIPRGPGGKYEDFISEVAAR